MAEKSIKKNFIFNLVYQIVIILAPIITTPYVARVLGAEGVGLYSYMGSIVSYFTLVATLGTSTFAQRKISFVQKNKEETSRAFWEMFLLRFILSTTMLAVYLVIFTVIFKENVLIYIILALNIPNTFLDISWFFQGMEEFGKISMRNIITRVISVALVFLLVKDAGDLWIYALLMAGSTVLGSLLIWPYMPKYLCKVRSIRPFRDLKGSILLFIPTVAIQIYTVLDKSMIGWFSSGSAENGYYEQAEKLVRTTMMVVATLSVVMIPRISKKFSEHDDEAIKNYMYRTYRFVWLLAVPIMLGWIGIADYIVPVFLGGGYEKCVLLICVFSPLLIIVGLNSTTNSVYLVPTNRHNVFTVIVLIGAVINFILNLCLIPFYFSLGAAIASVAAEFCVMVAGFVYVRKKKAFSLKPVITCSGKYILSGGIMFGAIALIKRFLPVNVWGLAALILSGAAVYFACLLIMRDRFVMDIVKWALVKAKIIKPKREEAAAGPECSIDPYPAAGGKDTEELN